MAPEYQPGVLNERTKDCNLNLTPRALVLFDVLKVAVF